MPLITKVQMEPERTTCPECGQPLLTIGRSRCCRNVSAHAAGLPVVDWPAIGPTPQPEEN